MPETEEGDHRIISLAIKSNNQPSPDNTLEDTVIKRCLGECKCRGFKTGANHRLHEAISDLRIKNNLCI